MVESYFLTVIESLGQVITGLKYQVESLDKENERLRKQLAAKEEKQ